MIDKFDGEFAFLSNFFMAPVRIEDVEYPSSEHAFQAMKTLNPEEREEIRKAATPGKAKRLGRKCTMRPNWEQKKFQVMLAVVRAKFRQHPELASKLIETGNTKLIEGNNWGDRVWGQVDGKGQNWLGEILMMVREDLKHSM